MAEADSNITEMRDILDSDKKIVGTEETIKGLKKGEITKVYVSSNVNPTSLDSIKHYSELSGAEVVSVKYPNDELGVLCKKPFSISVLGVHK